MAALVAAGLGAATLRLLVTPSEQIGSLIDAVARWCHHLLGNPRSIDEFLVLGLLALFPVAWLTGFASAARQWRGTRQLLAQRLGARLPALPVPVAAVAASLGIASKLDVTGDAQPYVFSYGLLRPRICLSVGLVGLLSEREIEAVLLHERYHLKSGDPAKILAVTALARVFFFVPVVGELAAHYLTTKEIAADSWVISEQGHRRWLASALYKLLSQVPSEPGAAGFASLLGSGDARLQHLLEPEGVSAVPVSARGLLTTGLVLLLVGTVAVWPEVLGAASHLHALAVPDESWTCDPGVIKPV